MLQCVAVCCSVLQYVIVFLPFFAVRGLVSSAKGFTLCCSVLQCGAACCSVLQCVAVCCGVLWLLLFPTFAGFAWLDLFGGRCCSLLQCVVVCCSVL